MTMKEKNSMFEIVRYDIHMADAWAREMYHGSLTTADQASELLRRCVKANASAQAYERAMHGVEPPKVG